MNDGIDIEMSAYARPVREIAGGLREFAIKMREKPGARWRCEGARDLALKLAAELEREVV